LTFAVNYSIQFRKRKLIKICSLRKDSKNVYLKDFKDESCCLYLSDIGSMLPLIIDSEISKFEYGNKNYGIC
jgi:hypothetical protein